MNSTIRSHHSEVDAVRHPSAHSNHWIWAIVSLSVLVCTGLAWMYVEHRRIAQIATNELHNLHHARFELGEGFMHISQAGIEGSPFAREKGIALIRQALSSFEETTRNLGIAGASDTVDFLSSIRAFEGRLLELSASGGDERKRQVEIRIALNELDEKVQRVDSIAQERFEKTSGLLYRQFATAIGMTILLLVVLILVLFRSGRVAKRLEAARRANERKLKLFIEHAPAAIAMFDTDMKYIAASHRFVTDYRLDGIDLVGRSHYEVFPEISERWKEIHRRCLGGATERAEEDPFPRGDGSMDWVRWEILPWHENSGEIGGILLFSEVVTERKRAEAAIRKSEETWRFIAENTADTISIFDMDLRRTYVSPSVLRLRGYTVEEAMAQSLDQTLTPDSYQKALKLLEEEEKDLEDAGNAASTRTWTVELQLVCKDGSFIWAEVILSLIRDENGKSVAIMVSSRDISARKRAEEKLRESERTLKLFVDNAPAAIAMFDRNMKYLAVSKRFITDFRLEGDIIGRSHYEMFPEMPERLKEIHRRCLGGATEKAEEDPFPWGDGSVDWVRWEILPWYETSGEIGGILFFSELITEHKEAQDALRSSEARYRRIIDTANEGIAMTDADNRISFVNRRMLEMTGFTEEEVVGRSFLDMVFPEDVQEHTRRMEKCRQGLSDTFERRFRRKDGSELWTIVSAMTLLDEQNRVQGSFAMFTDITGRKDAERALEAEHRSLERKVSERTAELAKANRELEDLYNGAPCGYHSLDADGIIIRINNTELNWLGYSLEEVAGKMKISECLTPDSLKTFRNIFPVFKEHGYMNNIELDMIRKDGTSFPVLLNATVVRDEAGNFVMSRSTLIDYSTQRKAAAEMREANAVLAHASKMKEEFLSTMSHEIRTPLNAVVMLNRLLSETGLTMEQQQLVRKMDLSTRNLLGIISDILDFSKIGAGRLDLESIPFNLDEVLDNLSSLTSIKAQEKDLEMLFLVDDHVPYQLVGDPVRLGQVLYNLAGNAVKFTESGEVVVSVAIAAQEDGHVELAFRVSDTGIGMDREQLQRIFQPFTQADASTSRRYGGTGLGLAISQSLVNLMGGTLIAESEPGIGSTFSFTIRYRVQEKQERFTPPMPDTLQGMRVLLVEDKESLRRYIAGILSHFPFEVTTVETGAEGIEEITRALHRKQPHGLILLDYAMPAMNGMETARRIRSISAMSNVPILLMAMNPMENAEIVKAAERGIVSLLGKPVSRSSLLDAVMTVFGERERYRAGVEPKTAAERFDNVHVLVVEDNEINQEVTKSLLEGKGIEVSIASNGKEAVDMCLRPEGMPFDLILMDIRMPLMDGYQATEEIRRHEAGKQVPIIAMSAEAIAGTAEKISGAGMNDYITKPIDPDRLFDRISHWSRRREAFPQSEQTRRERGEEAEFTATSSLNVNEGLARVQGNRELYGRLLRKFRRDHGDFMDAIRAEMAEADQERLLVTLHGMKGVVGNIGATSLFTQIAEMENSVRTGGERPDALRESMERLQGSFQSLIKDIDAYLNTTNGEARGDKPADASTQELMIEVMDMMSGYLEEYDARAVDYLPTLKKAFREGVFFAAIQEIEAGVNRYDYGRAQKALQTLRDKIQSLKG